VTGERDIPHLPHLATIDAYGKGGFRFADMSHRGSLLCLPGGIWAWPVVSPADIDGKTLAPVLASPDIDLFILGTGRDPWLLPHELREKFRARKIAVDVMITARAVPTFNMLFGENRRVAAGLIAVE
jgi:uncharacterized protein